MRSIREVVVLDEMDELYDGFDECDYCPYGIDYVVGSEHCEFCEYRDGCPEAEEDEYG